ncbi:MAG: metal ABC transporter permease, partial [Planctomycetota bacterium]
GLGVMLAIFFGTGLMLLRWIQRSSPPISGQAGLDDYLFGMAAAMTSSDLWMICSLALLSALTVLLCWSRLKVLTFDAEYAAGLGLPTGRWEVLLLALLVIGIVIGLQIVGVVLMVAMLIAPASAARQWTHSLGAMFCIAAGLGATCAASGAFLSSVQKGLPTGPVIVMLLTAVVIASVLLSPSRGVLFRRQSLVS